MSTLGAGNSMGDPMMPPSGSGGGGGGGGDLGISDDVLNDVAEVLGSLDADVTPTALSQQEQEDLNSAVNSIL